MKNDENFEVRTGARLGELPAVSGEGGILAEVALGRATSEIWLGNPREAQKSGSVVESGINWLRAIYCLEPSGTLASAEFKKQ